MTYIEARKYIENLKGRGIVPGLNSITRLLEKLGNPQNRLKFIHIAGTNGKGSAGAFLEAVLIEAGYKTARFVSPPVGDYLEMYTTDKKKVSENSYAKCVCEVQSAIAALEKDGIYPTSFEAETAIAFLLFIKYNADIVLLECGMGGLLDATNVIPTPLLAVITSVSKDHSTFLGDTSAEIAAHKCGIIKSGTTVITCAQNDEVMQVIKNTCTKNNARLYTADCISNISYGKDTSFVYSGNEYTIQLSGTYQPQNAAIAIEAALRLGIDRNIISEGLKKAEWRFRFEKIGKYILDGAHNPAAAKQLAESLRIYNTGAKTAFIVGVFKDKDYDGIAAVTAGYADIIYTVSPPSSRGLDSKILADAFRKYNREAYDGISIENVIKLTMAYDTVVVFGSLSILNEAKHFIENGSPMQRCNKIYNHPLYIECLKRIEEQEKDRIFCLHNLSHALDTARIGYIKILENKLDIDKELYYAAALLHDIGRCSGRPHSEAGALYAAEIMPDCGFSVEETQLVVDAILCHRTKSDGSSLADILSSADKESRMCFACKAADECYWADEKRNKEINI